MVQLPLQGLPHGLDAQHLAQSEEGLRPGTSHCSSRCCTTQAGQESGRPRPRSGSRPETSCPRKAQRRAGTPRRLGKTARRGPGLTVKISTMSLDVVRTGSTSFSLSTRIRLTPSVSRIHSCRALNSPSSVMMIFFLLSVCGRCMYTCRDSAQTGVGAGGEWGPEGRGEGPAHLADLLDALQGHVGQHVGLDAAQEDVVIHLVHHLFFLQQERVSPPVARPHHRPQPPRDREPGLAHSCPVRAREVPLYRVVTTQVKET